MNLRIDPPPSKVLTLWRRYLPAVNVLILSVPVLFYLLVVKSSESELVYTFRIANATDQFLYDVQIKSDEEVRCTVFPGTESELFKMKVRYGLKNWISREPVLVTVTPYADSMPEHSAIPEIKFYDRFSPDKLNKIQITAESIFEPKVKIE